MRYSYLLRHFHLMYIIQRIHLWHSQLGSQYIKLFIHFTKYSIISDTIPNQFQFPAAPSPAKSEQTAVDFWNSSAVMWW